MRCNNNRSNRGNKVQSSKAATNEPGVS